MKKKSFLIVSAALVSTMFFASCSTEMSTSFSSNWYKKTDTTTAIEGTHEKLTYSVALKDNSAFNTTYSVNYSNGVYTTDLKVINENEEPVYLYETKLNISVQYIMGSETSEVFKDEITTSVVFKNAQSGLRPVRSEKKVLSHSPSNQFPSSLATSYVIENYAISTTYESKTKGESVLKQTIGEETVEKKTKFSISNKYSYVDSESLMFAIRGMNLSAAQKINIYSSGRKSVLPVNINPAKSTDDKFTLKIDGSPAKEFAISYVPVNISYGVENPGSTQTAWYAKKNDNPLNNIYRNVMLKNERPVSYGLGTLVYTLTEAEFANQ